MVHMKKINKNNDQAHSQFELLDLYCGAGGCSVGYKQAGFNVTGIDHLPQTNYPYRFILSKSCCFFWDYLNQYDVIHLSPPCQKYSKLSRANGKKYSNELEYWVKSLIHLKKPFVIENVPGSPLPVSIKLSGQMFQLNLQRTRFFYSNILLFQPCEAKRIYRSPGSVQYPTVAGNGQKGDTLKRWSTSMGINWMKKRELAQAIPPAYTKFIGDQLMTYLINKTMQWCI